MNTCSRTDELRMNFGELSIPDAEFHESRADPRAIDTVAPLNKPSSAQLLSRFSERVLRQKLVCGCTVVPRFRMNVQSGGPGEPFKQAYIPPDVVGRALHQ